MACSAAVENPVEDAVELCEAVQRVVGFGHAADFAAERVCVVFAGHAAVLVELGDVDLDRGVVLGAANLTAHPLLQCDLVLRL